jgi:hypothetical protein
MFHVRVFEKIEEEGLFICYSNGNVKFPIIAHNIDGSDVLLEEEALFI